MNALSLIKSVTAVAVLVSCNNALEAAERFQQSSQDARVNPNARFALAPCRTRIKRDTLPAQNVPQEMPDIASPDVSSINSNEWLATDPYTAFLCARLQRKLFESEVQTENGKRTRGEWGAMGSPMILRKNEKICSFLGVAQDSSFSVSQGSDGFRWDQCPSLLNDVTEFVAHALSVKAEVVHTRPLYFYSLGGAHFDHLVMFAKFFKKSSAYNVKLHYDSGTLYQCPHDIARDTGERMNEQHLRWIRARLVEKCQKDDSWRGKDYDERLEKAYAKALDWIGRYSLEELAQSASIDFTPRLRYPDAGGNALYNYPDVMYMRGGDAVRDKYKKFCGQLDEQKRGYVGCMVHEGEKVITLHTSDGNGTKSQKEYARRG